MIPVDLQDLLQPLEQFEAIRREFVPRGARLCDFSFANPYEGAGEQVRAVLRSALDRQRLLDFQYAPFGGHTLVRRAVADHLRARSRLAFRYEDVVLTPGAMSALHVALRLSAQPGEEVLIPVPCWLDHPLYAAQQGLRPVLVPLRGPGFDLDVTAIADRITSRTAALLLSNPSNPAGRSYSHDALGELAAALELVAARTGRRVTVIADEVHRDFAAPGRHQNMAAAWPATITVYSFGKYHFIQGQRIGYLAISPLDPRRASLAAEAVRWTRVLGFCTPTAVMQAAVPDLLALCHDLTPLIQCRAQVAAELENAGYDVTPADATLFLYVRTPGDRDDFEFIRSLAEAGALALPAPVFHHRGHFRLSLTAGSSMIERGLAALRRVACA